MWIAINKKTLDLGPFLWFGAAPGERLPDISGYPTLKRTTHNAEGDRPFRRNHHELPRSAFASVAKIDDLIVRLFGPTPMR